jgi:serine/threonine protein kinase
MSHQPACPDATCWPDMLDGNLPPGEQTRLAGHLDSCERCQQQVEGLLAETDPWRLAPGALSSPPPEAPLRRVMAQLKGEAAVADDEPATVTAAEPALDFLDPPADPGHLGCLGRYHVIEVIGRGGMGVVLKAFDPALNRFVAVKVLAPQWAGSVAARLRFQREGRAAAAIRHENVVAVHGVEEVNGLPYLVMEYVHGVSLEQRLEQEGSLELQEVLRIGTQIADGLAAAHKQGLVHRDVKPANILLENGVERVKITDFGLARAIDDASLTQSGMIAGTPLYMAPEQARGDMVDHRADLFSLGSVLYALCTGKPPFRAPTTLAVLRRVCEESPRPIQQLNPDVPKWMAEIIAVLHAKKPADRFQSATDLSQLLSLRLAHLQNPATVPEPPPPAQPRRPRSRRGRRRLWVTLAAVLGGLAALWLVYLGLSQLGRLAHFRLDGKQGGDQNPQQPVLPNMPGPARPERQGGGDLNQQQPGLPFPMPGPPRPGWRGPGGKFGLPGFGPQGGFGPRGAPNGDFHLDGDVNGVPLGIDGELTDAAVLVHHVAIKEGGKVKEYTDLDKVPAPYRDVIPLILHNVARGRPIRSAKP